MNKVYIPNLFTYKVHHFLQGNMLIRSKSAYKDNTPLEKITPSPSDIHLNASPHSEMTLLKDFEVRVSSSMQLLQNTCLGSLLIDLGR